MEGTLADLHGIDSPKKTDEQICFIFLPGRVISKKIPTRSFFFLGKFTACQSAYRFILPLTNFEFIYGQEILFFQVSISESILSGQ